MSKFHRTVFGSNLMKDVLFDLVLYGVSQQMLINLLSIDDP